MTKKTPPLLLLASSSPQRKKILYSLGLKFHAQSPDIAEINDNNLLPNTIVVQNSYKKAMKICCKNPSSTVIGCDTIVYYKGKILTKPQKIGKNIEMLLELSGNMHLVYTGLSIINKKHGSIITCFETTRVFLNNVSNNQIENYVKDKKPLNKAGGYGIQELPKDFISKIEGDYLNVVGFPADLFLKKYKYFC